MAGDGSGGERRCLRRMGLRLVAASSGGSGGSSEISELESRSRREEKGEVAVACGGWLDGRGDAGVTMADRMGVRPDG